MAGLTLAAAILVFLLEGWAGVREGFLAGIDTLRAAGLPFILGISAAGMIPVILSAKLVSRWMGEGSGFKGTLTGVAGGLLTPGGPYVMFPIAASLFKSGATAGPMAALTATRNLVPINRIIVWELALLGATFPIVRSVVAIPLVFVAAALVPVVLRIINRARKKSG